MWFGRLCMWGYRRIIGFLAFLFVWCIYGSFFLYRDWSYNLLGLFTGAAVYLLLVFLFYALTSYISPRVQTFLAAGLIGLFAIGSLFIGTHLTSARMADIGNLHYAAKGYLENGSLANSEYFSLFPFQRNLTYIYIGVYRLGQLLGSHDLRLSGSVYGAFMLTLSALLVYQLGQALSNRRLGLCALFLYVSNPTIYLYTSYYYTDLSGMPFFLAILYLGALAIRRPERSCRPVFLLLGLLGHTGMQIRSTTGIAVIAVFIVLFLTDWKKTLRVTPFFLLGILPSYALWGYLTATLGGTIDPTITYPATHWLMLGSNPASGGQWSGELCVYSQSFPSYEEKIAGHLVRIKAHLSDMGLSGSIDLLLKKWNTLWSSGMIGLRSNLSNVTKYGKLYEYTVGSKRFVLSYVAQSLRCAALLLTLPALRLAKKKTGGPILILPIVTVGYTIFYSFWEVHEKYILMFLPVLFIFASLGIAVLWADLQSLWRLLSSAGKVRARSTALRGVALLQIATLVIALTSAHSLLSVTADRYEMRLQQSAGSMQLPITIDGVAQSFSLDQPFNQISIVFARDEAVADEQIYVVSITDGDQQLYRQDFLARDIQNGKEFSFSFPTIHPAGENSYQFHVKALSSYDHTIATFAQNAHIDYRKNIDYTSYLEWYDNGQCLISDQPLDSDMRFTITQMFNGPLMSKPVFYGLLIGMLLLESATFFWLFHLGKVTRVSQGTPARSARLASKK